MVGCRRLGDRRLNALWPWIGWRAPALPALPLGNQHHDDEDRKKSVRLVFALFFFSAARYVLGCTYTVNTPIVLEEYQVHRP
jgi:hypothetical protein